jgi:uncharacterized tellurite resistance protein B-like protein
VDDSERRRLCSLVKGVLLADDHFADDERRFMERVAVRAGLPPDEIASLSPIAVGDASAAMRAMPREAQNQVAALLVEAAVADGVIHPRERVYLLVVAAAMGLDAVVMEQRIAARLEVLSERAPASRVPPLSSNSRSD